MNFPRYYAKDEVVVDETTKAAAGRMADDLLGVLLGIPPSQPAPHDDALSMSTVAEDGEAAYYEWLAEGQQSEIDAENGWLRAAEYDPRMDDPREW